MEKTEGIILHSLPFKDYDQIITLYTKDLGLISAVVRAARSQKRGLSSLIHAINRVEIVFKRGREDLHFCRELSPLNYYLFLREDMQKLEAACELVKAVKTSQGTEDPSPVLYGLLKTFIERLETSSSLSALTSSFRLKILSHDGLLHWGPSCSVCRSSLNDYFFFKGEPFCFRHCPRGGVRFAKEDAEMLGQAVCLRRLSLIESLPIRDDLALSVKNLFDLIYL